jgi:hypothetical protein
MQCNICTKKEAAFDHEFELKSGDILCEVNGIKTHGRLFGDVLEQIVQVKQAAIQAAETEDNNPHVHVHGIVLSLKRRDGLNALQVRMLTAAPPPAVEWLSLSVPHPSSHGMHGESLPSSPTMLYPKVCVTKGVVLRLFFTFFFFILGIYRR